MKEEEKLHNLRHTLAHLLAAAVLELYPKTKYTIGPAIDNGFYYDFDFSSPIAEKDLAKIESKMKEILGSWEKFHAEEKTAEEAKEYFKDNPYKLELINEIVEKGEKITFYTCGDFTDLCRGGHLENPKKEISEGSFKLERLAGAYWRGDEKNTMLTRIYGLAFETPKDLEEYEKMKEEAIKRDHRKLGKELDLFTFSELVGPGLPLWTPKGTLVRNLLDDFVWELRKERGYEKVEIPHITKKDLFITSGHWSKFSDELFKITTREGHEFAMKPMNCPFHTQIFARNMWSYKDMPQRYANTTVCYRDEQTGELHGLSRVRAFAQDDAHVFCTEDQVKEEAFKVWDIIETFYGKFGFDIKIRLSVHDSQNMDKYLGTLEDWDRRVKEMESWVKERGADYTIASGEAAFYGPKIDFITKDSLGREWQVATIQADHNMPNNFDLTYINKEGNKAPVVMLHAAIMGSIERFLSVYIEHSAGNFPFWLSPVQVKILPISEEKHGDFAQAIYEKLKNEGIRIELDASAESLGKKIRNAKTEKVPYLVVIGDKEKDSGKLTVEGRKGKLEDISIEDLLQTLKKEIKDKALE